MSTGEGMGAFSILTLRGVKNPDCEVHRSGGWPCLQLVNTCRAALGPFLNEIPKVTGETFIKILTFMYPDDLSHRTE